MKLRQKFLTLTALFSGVALTGCNACTEQHNPRPDHARFNQESTIGNAPIKSLNPDGTLPKVEEAPKAAVANASGAKNPGVTKYQQFCTACHGADGAAAGAAAAAMNPRPRNFTDKAWQDSVDDAHIAKVIKEGGSAVGLSPTMAPWGAMVSDDEIKQMVAHIRGFKK